MRRRRSQGDVLFSFLFSCGLSVLVGLVERLVPCLWVAVDVCGRCVCAVEGGGGEGESRDREKGMKEHFEEGDWIRGWHQSLERQAWLLWLQTLNLYCVHWTS